MKQLKVYPPFAIPERYDPKTFERISPDIQWYEIDDIRYSADGIRISEKVPLRLYYLR